MRVMITGATGFVGYHTARALLDAGHEVSLLVRSVDKMLALFGEDRVHQVTRGDITDAAQVSRALQDCDAVVHSAAMVSTSAGDAKRVYQTNVEGTRLVVGGAIDRGVGRVIHVSSVTALYDPAASSLDETSPPGRASNAYGRSKVDCERYVRDLQDRGAPVLITYPAQVIGPDDPGLTEPHVGLQLLLKGLVPCTSSGTQYVDVRDIAQVHSRLLAQTPPGNRYVLGGHYLDWRGIAQVLESVTGRHLLKVPLPGIAARISGQLYDRLGAWLPLDLPFGAEAMEYATRWVALDNTRVETELDFSFRPLEDSLRDTIAWMYRQGLVSRRQAGQALG
ncbi:MAG: SDR family NAD(P)-dependent oxidoreductase [Haliea sp.]|uniref:SDR family NAD(P)-dependent oxidoreductase n=1 Tax=Haliea sp. TaxID=1932666 RepID=UPI0032EB15C1